MAEPEYHEFGNNEKKPEEDGQLSQDEAGQSSEMMKKKKKNKRNRSDEEAKGKKKKKKKKKETDERDRRGICYMSRVPPHMDPFKLRQLLSEYGDIERLYLAPKNPSAQVRRKPGARRPGVEFSEGWIEFSDKRVAKRVADMLNGEQIGGRKRSALYYDLWNIKYLSKFKWDDLTEEIAYKHAVREQKLALEISTAKKERDFYLKKVDKARALSSIEERLKKKQKLQEELGVGEDVLVSQQAPKVIRKFPQNKPVTSTATESKPRLSKDILAGVFGGS